jgi:hypothetical protein
MYTKQHNLVARLMNFKHKVKITTYKLETYCGQNFDGVAKKAKEIAFEKNVTVEFEFNGCICLVNSETNLEHLSLDYSTHWIMEWKTIGPICYVEYPENIKREIDRRKKIRQEKAALELIEYNNKKNKEKQEFQDKINGIDLDLILSDEWASGKAKNTDGYGACIYEYAEGWGKLMQVEIAKGKELKDIAESTSYQMDFLGITGFMYGAAVKILSQCWKHGEELRKWHNKEYNHEGDGVVNPAVITF